jgi:hypothetical protein
MPEAGPASFVHLSVEEKLPGRENFARQKDPCPLPGLYDKNSFFMCLLREKSGKQDAKLEWMLIIGTLQGANSLQGRINNQEQEINKPKQ